jgi:hypothetical protein
VRPLGGAPNRSVCKVSHAARDDGICRTTNHRFLSNSCQIHLRGVCRSPPWRYIRLRRTAPYTQRLPICGEPRTRSEADKFPPPPDLLPIPSRSSSVSIAGSQKVVYDEISDVTTQSLAGRKVEEKMHTGKDAAQRCFFCGSRKARE